jgi:hypothetical protein
VIPRADLVFRVDSGALFGAGTKLRSRGLVLTVIGALLAFVGLLSTAYGILAIVWHDFRDQLDVVAGIAGMVVLAAPLGIALLLLILGMGSLGRGAVLVELARIVHGRTHVTVLDLAAHTGKPPEVVLANLTLAARHAAATLLDGGPGPYGPWPYGPWPPNPP